MEQNMTRNRPIENATPAGHGLALPVNVWKNFCSRLLVAFLIVFWHPYFYRKAWHIAATERERLAFYVCLIAGAAIGALTPFLLVHFHEQAEWVFILDALLTLNVIFFSCFLTGAVCARESDRAREELGILPVYDGVPDPSGFLLTWNEDPTLAGAVGNFTQMVEVFSGKAPLIAALALLGKFVAHFFGIQADTLLTLEDLGAFFLLVLLGVFNAFLIWTANRHARQHYMNFYFSKVEAQG
jgi:hypothetical protein